MTYLTDLSLQAAEHATAVNAEHESAPWDYVSIGGLLEDRDRVPDRRDA